MDETTELEEGEACYYKDDGNNINLDSLSYIDERIQHVLGHFQKDFEGTPSAENLGAKFGGYGSFLPAHGRSPTIWSHPKTPQRNYSSPSPNNVHIEGSSHTSRPPSNVSTSRLGTASHSANSFHNLKVSSFDNSMKQDVGLPSNLVAEGCPSKHDKKNKSHNSTDQRTLKLRIKVKSDYSAQKNAAIYSNLGLGNSPSSSMGNSPEGSGGMPPVSQETAEESPTGIIQVMTDFPVPGGVLLSPLHDSLLYLIRKEKVLADNRSVSSLNGHQEHCSMSTDESDSFVGNGQLSKRNVRIVNKHERQLELKHMSSNGVENDMAIHMKKRVGNRTPDHKEFLSNDLKCTPLSSSVCDAGEIAEATGKTSEILKGFNKEEVKGRMTSAEATKEESLESISCQDLDKSEKQHTESGFGEKILENKQASSYNDKSMNTKKCKSYMTSERAKGGVIKCKVAQDPQKHVISQKKKPLWGGKSKLEEEQSPSNAVTVAKKDNSGAVSNAMMTEKKSAGFGVSSCSSKMNKMKLPKDIKVNDSCKNSSKGKGLESVVRGMDPIDRPCGHQPIINAKLDNFEEHSAYVVKVNERPSANKMGNQIVGPCVKDGSNAFPVAESNPSVEMVPAATAAPCLIEEHWVCCDSCQKWRLLPLGMMPEQLPDKWLCSMLNWLPGMNQCEISEEETTKSLRACYQVPISDGQSNMQNHATETAIVMSSSGALQIGLNIQNHNSDVMSDQRKKKLGIKEKMEPGSSSDPFLFSTSTKKGPQDSVKNRRLTIVDRHPTDSNPMKKTSSQHPRKLHNSVAEKHMAKESDKQISRGNGKHIKLKRKIDQYKCATPKKSKTQDMYHADKRMNHNMDLEKVSSISRNDLPAKVTGMDTRKYDEYCLSENAKEKLVVPMKNEGVQTQVLLNGDSLNLTNNNTKDGSVKKRKLKDRQDNDNHGDTFSLQDNDSISGSRKEKMYKVLSKEGKSVIEGEHKLNRKGKVSQVCLLGGGDYETVDGEVRSADKDQELRKHRKNLSSQPTLEGIDPLGRDLGSGQLSLAATSSSSKVSGSHKARTNFDDVKNSPVGSVTSSPLRTSNMDKLISAGGDASGKDGGVKGGLSSLSSKKCLDNRGEKQIVKMKEKVSFNLHPESQKLSPIKYRVGGANDNCRVQSKTSCEVNDDHLLNGGVSTVEQRDCGANGTHRGDRMKNKQESELYGQKSCIGISSLRGMAKDRRSGSEFNRNTMKASVTENGYSRIGGSYELAVDTNDHASGHETINDAQSKCESDHIRKKNFVRYQLSENGKQSEPKQEDFENSILKDASCTTDRKRLSQQNLTQGFDGGNKAVPAHRVSRDGPSKVFPPLDSKGRRETLSVDSRSALESQKEGMSSEPVHAPSNGDVARLMKCSVDATSKGDVNRCSGKFESDCQPTVSSPVRTCFSQNAFNTLKEATKLKDTADHYKNSGFEFESNETYFDAALKFLHGASPLENCQSDSFRHGEISQMHIYATTAKLFESCAHEYERRQEMAAAALAYKCMEVAFMRVVYSKTSSTIRDHDELQSSLKMVPQGESPSSSASDVDNLNNQAAGVKMTLPRGTGNHVAGNQVISARYRPNFVRLLDFTQDVNLAMEASRKCQITFAAANKIMEEACNGDCITSVRKVIDFSFQDVDELVHLVRSARKAISHAGLGGARE